MNLEGAIHMILSDAGGDREDEASDAETDDGDKEELAVDIVKSVRLGSGARITCLAAWCNQDSFKVTEHIEERVPVVEEEETALVMEQRKPTEEMTGTKRKQEEVEMDIAAVEKARSLVKQAKKMKKKKDRKKRKAAENP
jgi:hypothetical protein